MAHGLPGLGELASNAAQLHHWHTSPEGHDQCHLQQQPVEVPDVVGAELREGLGAIAALQEMKRRSACYYHIAMLVGARIIAHLHDEGLADGDLGQAALQRPALPGEN